MPWQIARHSLSLCAIIGTKTHRMREMISMIFEIVMY